MLQAARACTNSVGGARAASGQTRACTALSQAECCWQDWTKAPARILYSISVRQGEHPLEHTLDARVLYKLASKQR